MLKITPNIYDDYISRHMRFDQMPRLELLSLRFDSIGGRTTLPVGHYMRQIGISLA